MLHFFKNLNNNLTVRNGVIISPRLAILNK